MRARNLTGSHGVLHKSNKMNQMKRRPFFAEEVFFLFRLISMKPPVLLGPLFSKNSRSAVKKWERHKLIEKEP